MLDVKQLAPLTSRAREARHAAGRGTTGDMNASHLARARSAAQSRS